MFIIRPLRHTFDGSPLRLCMSLFKALQANTLYKDIFVMGILSASSTLTRFRLIDAVPETLWPTVLDKLKQFAFQDIDNTFEERSFGWVSFEDMLDTEWNSAPPAKGAYIAFALRLDTRRIPAAISKKYVLMSMRDEKIRMQEQGKQFISRERRTELRDLVKQRLMSKVLPIPAIFDVVWATDTNIIYLASTRSPIIDMFSTHFTRSFELHLEPLTPYTVATLKLDETDIAKLDSLEQTLFS